MAIKIKQILTIILLAAMLWAGPALGALWFPDDSDSDSTDEIQPVETTWDLRIPSLVNCTGDIETDAYGIFQCGTDDTGSAGTGQWSTTTGLIYYDSGSVVVGNNATSGDAIFEVVGNSIFDAITASGNITATGDVTGANLNISNWDNAYTWKNSAIDGSDRLKMAYGGTEADLSAIATGGLIAGDGAGSVGVLNVGTDLYALVASSTASAGVAWQKLDISIGTNLSASDGITLTGDNLTADLGTEIDISDETNLATSTGISLTGDTLGLTLGEIDHDSTLNFLAAEHVDWAGVSAGTIHTDNYIENPFGASIDSNEITDGAIAEVDLKAVDEAVDEDIFTYEDTTGDFEWHTKAELGIGTATAITDGLIIEADLNADEEPADNDILTFDTTGANFSWQTPTELALMEDEDINTFSELQSWISDEVLLKSGTLTDAKFCKYDLASTDIICNYDEADPSVDTADEIEALLTNDAMDFGSGAVTSAGGFVGDVTGACSGASGDVSCAECLIIGTEVKAGTLTDTKYCIWDTANSQIVCDSTPAGSGDVESVGDCSTGACFDGTSDGGTYLDFYDAEGAVRLITGNVASSITLTLPTATGTLIYDGQSIGGLTMTDSTTTNATATNMAITGTLAFPNDSILDAMIDWGNLTDLNAGGEVAWGNLGAGELADDSVQAADIDTINAGRSTTWDATNDEIDADAELYVFKAKIAFEDPVATDDFFFGEVGPYAVTFTSIYCKTLVGTVDLDVSIAGTDINGTDITCNTTGVLDDSLGGDTAGATGEELALVVTSVASSPTYLMVIVNGTYDD